MSWVATAIAGSAVIGAYSSSKGASAQADAAKDAGNVELTISRENIKAQQEALDKILATNSNTLATTTALNQPWQDAGLAALQFIANGTVDGSLMPLGSSLNQRPYVAPTKEEILAAAGGSDDPAALLKAAQEKGYTGAELEQAFGYNKGDAAAWIAANTDVRELAGSDRPEDAYRVMQQYGLSPDQMDQEYGVESGAAANWIDQNVTQPARANVANSLLGAAGSASTLKPFEFQQFQTPDNLQPGSYTAPEDFQFSGGDFSYADYTRPEFNFEADPGYQFRKEEGMNALERVASVRGRLASPAQGKATERYVQGLAAQEYANAFNRYLAETDRDQTQYNTDRSFAYGNYIDNYNMDFGEYQDNRNFNYGAYRDDEASRAAQRAEAYQQFQNQQNAQYTDYTNRVNLENNRRQQVLNTALQIAGLGRGATDSNIAATGASGNNVMNAISTTTNNVTGQNTNGGTAVANSLLNRGNAAATGYSGIAQSANQGIENYLLYKTAS